MIFFKQFLHYPCLTGAICSSGAYLVRALAKMALEDKQRKGLIIDLGAGSGVVSQALLSLGIPANDILAIDISSHWKNIFHKNCPEIKLRIADARNLVNITARHYPGRQIRAVVSSLPLRSLSAAMVMEIMQTLRLLLQKGGSLIQFTYALWQRTYLEKYGFKYLRSQLIARNIPPALAEKYEAVK